VVGKNPFWKQEGEIGKKNNQAFVQIPHAQFITMLEYKGKLVLGSIARGMSKLKS